MYNATLSYKEELNKRQKLTKSIFDVFGEKDTEILS